MPDHHLDTETFPNIQPKPPLTELHAPSDPVTDTREKMDLQLFNSVIFALLQVPKGTADTFSTSNMHQHHVGVSTQNVHWCLSSL